MYTQQGDVIVFHEEKLPKNLRPIKGKTVALGEATGHHHTFYGGDVCLYEDENKTIWGEINSPTMLKHQEHKPIDFKPGIFRIGIVREYDHVEKLSRKVVD